MANQSKRFQDVPSRRAFMGTAGLASLSGVALSDVRASEPTPPAIEPAAPHDRQFLCSDGLRNAVHKGQKGVIVKVRLPDYRSLPLSCIVGMELSIDGERVDPGTIDFILAEYSHKLKELPALHTVTWWILDTADLFVPGANELKPGEHDVSGTLIFLLPYATGGSITLQSSAKKRLLLESAV